jgi:hypothetical protein
MQSGFIQYYLATTGVVIKNTAAKEPYKYIEGEERKIEGTQGNTT